MTQNKQNFNFDTFINELNNFVKHRGCLAQFDTPVRIALNCVDEAQISFIRDSDEDTAFFEILNQFSRKVSNERSRLRTKIQNIALKMSSAIVQEGINLVAEVGGSENFEIVYKHAEINVQKHDEKAGQEMQTAIKLAIADIQQEIQEVLQGNLVQTFVAYIENNQDISAKNINSGINTEGLKQQVGMLKEIGEAAGLKITNLATRGFLNTSGQVFLRSIDQERKPSNSFTNSSVFADTN